MEWPIKSSQNFQIAFALTNYDSNPDPIEDPDYGVVKAYLKSWGNTGDSGVNFIELSTRFCREEDLGLTEETARFSLFFKPHESSITDARLYINKMKCITAPFEVYGAYDSAKA